MELIKRYVQAVTGCLPESQRKEVARELSASIEDMARDKSDGKKPTEKHIREVLEELGDPCVVARHYRGTAEYLIGPAVYYQYVQFLKKIIAISLPIYTLVFAIAYDYVFPLSFGDMFIDWLGGMCTVTLHVLFWITAMFFVIERTGMKVDQINADQAEWSVDSLPTLARTPQISRVDTIASLVFYAFLIVGGLVLWRLLSEGGQASSVATYANPELRHFWIPALIAYGAMALIVEVIKFARGRWSVWLVAAALTVNALGILYMATLASSQSILNPALSMQAYQIGMWSVGITVAVFIFSYIYESYKIVRSARSEDAKH